jgi:hypothetical protein
VLGFHALILKRLHVSGFNSLKIAGKIPGAWLVQIKNAGHAIVNQYPAEVGKIMNTFLLITGQNR